jgi:hypothetical protein
LGPLITASGHFLRECQQKLAVGLFGPAEAFDQVSKIHRLFAGTAEYDVVRRFSLEQVRKRWRFLSVVKALI